MLDKINQMLVELKYKPCGQLSLLQIAGAEDLAEVSPNWRTSSCR